MQTNKYFSSNTRFQRNRVKSSENMGHSNSFSHNRDYKKKLIDSVNLMEIVIHMIVIQKLKILKLQQKLIWKNQNMWTTFPHLVKKL